MAFAGARDPMKLSLGTPGEARLDGLLDEYFFLAQSVKIFGEEGQK